MWRGALKGILMPAVGHLRGTTGETTPCGGNAPEQGSNSKISEGQLSFPLFQETMKEDKTLYRFGVVK